MKKESSEKGIERKRNRTKKENEQNIGIVSCGRKETGVGSKTGNGMKPM